MLPDTMAPDQQRPSEAARAHMAAVLEAWLGPDEPPAEVSARDDFSTTLRALRAVGVNITNQDPAASLYMVTAIALRHGRREGEILSALLDASDALGDLLDAADLARERLECLSQLLADDTGGGARG